MDTQYEAWLEEQHNHYINQVTESGLPLYMLDMYEVCYSMSNPALNKSEDKNSHLLTLVDFNSKGLALNYMEWFKCDLGTAYKKYLELNTVRNPDQDDDPVLPQDTYDGEPDDGLPF
jgi:hypothetical protein